MSVVGTPSREINKVIRENRLENINTCVYVCVCLCIRIFGLVVPFWLYLKWLPLLYVSVSSAMPFPEYLLEVDPMQRNAVNIQTTDNQKCSRLWKATRTLLQFVITPTALGAATLKMNSQYNSVSKKKKETSWTNYK